MKATRIAAGLSGTLVAALVLTACGSSSSSGGSSTSSSSSSSSSSAAASGSSSGGGGGGTVIVGSANFAESELVMNIYAAALKAKGVNATTKPKIGSREVYIPAIKDGSIDLIPEYSGTLLDYLDKSATAVSSDDVYKALPAALGSDLKVLDQSQAQDKDSIAVTADTASKNNLKSIADLSSKSSTMILGAAPEFETRTDGVPGLKKVYNVTFKSFKVTDAGGPKTVAALKQGQVDAADLFTTDPSIKANNFVVLDDPKNLYNAQNVLPLISAKKDSPAIDTALNAVSAKLTTDVLIDLNGKVASGTDPAQVASDWLKSVGLV